MGVVPLVIQMMILILETNISQLFIRNYFAEDVIAVFSRN